MAKPAFVAGIDLGTTNSALSYVAVSDLPADRRAPVEVHDLPVPQLLKAGEVGPAALLPSFLYLPAAGEIAPESLGLPWDAARAYAVGTFARDHGGRTPTRLVSSSKSWLSHSGADRQGPLLPWTAESGFPKISPIEAAARVLRHMSEAWAACPELADHPLGEQEVVLTVPASFDAVARELTLQAARQAGLTNVTLFEEPQAAFYAWLRQVGDRWRKLVRPGDVVLVVDVGGGTTDLTLIAVGEQEGDLGLERLAVGDHLLLGGDNMDLALAHILAGQLKEKLPRPDPSQMLALWQAARVAKEALLADPAAKPQPVTLLARGSKLVGGTLKTTLDRATVERIVLEGFFPVVPPDAEPSTAAGFGLQEIGLPYASDTAVTRHLASCLRRHADTVKAARGGSPWPSAVLFNGGVFQSEILRSRVLETLRSWGGEVRELPSADLDRSVARGAAGYGLAKRGRGVRVRAGLARSYYLGIASAMPPVPGMAPPLRALCIAAHGTEEGTSADLPGRTFGLVVGQSAEFPLLASAERPHDKVGDLLDDWEDTIKPVAPLVATIPADGDVAAGRLVPVRLGVTVTEIGTLEVACKADSGKAWQLAFDVREK